MLRTMRSLLLLAPPCLALLCLALPLGAATDRPLKSFPDAQLKEAPAGGDVLFVVSGDDRPATRGVLRTIFAEIGLIRPDFVVWTGGTVDSSIVEAARPISGAVPLLSTPGPQDLYGSFDYAGAHFIVLDTRKDEISGGQLAWLKRDLESNKEARAIFVFSHTEPRRSELQDLFRRYSVKALPYRGGISHYLVVRLAGETVSYDVLEPGRLSTEPAPSNQNETKLLIVNSNDTERPLPIRGIEVESPLKPARCEGLIATAAVKQRDAWTPLDGVAIDDCMIKDGTPRLHVKVPPLPKGSVLVTVRRNAIDGRPIS